MLQDCLGTDGVIGCLFDEDDGLQRVAFIVADTAGTAEQDGLLAIIQKGTMQYVASPGRQRTFQTKAGNEQGICLQFSFQPFDEIDVGIPFVFFLIERIAGVQISYSQQACFPRGWPAWRSCPSGRSRCRCVGIWPASRWTAKADGRQNGMYSAGLLFYQRVYGRGTDGC